MYTNNVSFVANCLDESDFHVRSESSSSVACFGRGHLAESGHDGIWNVKVHA
jgi:hypothetical protein